MPDRPTRPGRHAARHRAPTRTSHVLQRLRPAGVAGWLRGGGGTVVALGSLVLAGAAGQGSLSAAMPGSAEDQGRGSVAAAAPANARDTFDVRATRAERAVAAARASRSRPRTPPTDSHTARAESVVPDDPRAIAREMMGEYGWGEAEFSCLDDLWVSESDWDVAATNPTSGAYGIPQALPPEKMARAGADWRTNPATQVEWGLWYIDQSYGTPCSAWEFKQANNWY